MYAFISFMKRGSILDVLQVDPRPGVLELMDATREKVRRTDLHATSLAFIWEIVFVYS
jgi:hypothetical protein